MTSERDAVRGRRALIGAVVGIILAVLLAPRLVALSDALWARVLPWALLIVFWCYVLVRYRRGTLPGAGSGPGRPGS
jgi:uncharacterized RDD family membrane protein YckC